MTAEMVKPSTRLQPTSQNMPAAIRSRLAELAPEIVMHAIPGPFRPAFFSVKVVVGGCRWPGSVVLTAIVMVMAAMRHVRHHKHRIVLLADVRQLFDKCHRGPQLRVAVIAPGWHAGHLDAVLDDPEQLGGAVQRRGFGQIRWRWIKALGDVAARHAGRAVTDGAMRPEMLDAHRDVHRVIEARRDLDGRRVRLDRADAG